MRCYKCGTSGVYNEVLGKGFHYCRVCKIEIMAPSLAAPASPKRSLEGLLPLMCTKPSCGCHNFPVSLAIAPKVGSHVVCVDATGVSKDIRVGNTYLVVAIELNGIRIRTAVSGEKCYTACRFVMKRSA